MAELKRIGTTYLPVSDLARSKEWYVKNLSAEVSYADDEKVILNLADQSFFLIPSKSSETNSFIDVFGNTWFAATFEVDGEQALQALHYRLKANHVEVGSIEERGHTGKNFQFWDEDKNHFDVWSEWRERNASR